MPHSTFIEMPTAEHAEMLAALRRARYGSLLALHMLLWCAAGRTPTDIAAVLCCSRASVVPHRACLSTGQPRLEARRSGTTQATGAHDSAASEAATLAGRPAQGAPAGVGVVPHALERCHAGPDVADHAGEHGLRRDHAALGS
jgi:hypothetical protein